MLIYISGKYGLIRNMQSMVQRKGGAPEAVRLILNSVLTRFLRVSK